MTILSSTKTELKKVPAEKLLAPAEEGASKIMSNNEDETDYVYDGEDDLECARQSNNKNNNRKDSSSLIVINVPVVGAINLRGKHQLRAAVQTFAFVTLLVGCAVFQIYSGATQNLDVDNTNGFDLMEDQQQQQQLQNLRFLSNQTSAAAPDDAVEDYEDLVLCDSLETADSWWMTILYIVGILYTFLALAIVCDEFFVPALEEMSGPRRMNLSMDVAGATLMAAGGSAPELATSLIGTFRQSEIGFGTIVGSAVFNVLFVIAMCSILAKEVLTLTWYPLFRDTVYYTLGLVVLAVFTGFSTKNTIEWWEALVLFGMYLGYILLMWKNKNLYKVITGKELIYPEEEDDEDNNNNENNDDEEHGRRQQQNDGNNDLDATESSDDDKDDSIAFGTSPEDEKMQQPEEEEKEEEQIKKSTSKRSIGSNHSDVTVSSLRHIHSTTSPHFRTTFRAGVLKLLKDGFDSWLEIVGTGMVAKIYGDADSVFEQVDKDGNGFIDKIELKQLFHLLEYHQATKDEIDEVFDRLKNEDGMIGRKEFTAWYCRSEERIISQVRHVFDRIDADKSNTLDKEELKTLLSALSPNVSDGIVQSAIEEMHEHGDPNQITFPEFRDWYKRSMIYQRQKQQIEEDMNGVWENLHPPNNKDGGATARDWIWYIICLPLVFVLTLTIPDVQRPGMARWCYLSFFLSIAWIGAFSYFMVDWAEIVGNTFGIPADIMGLTVLAAGTSVPDLLSSVIVARRGQGDMAISSSIGSNIFDILVGLPVPWMLYSAAHNGSSVYIGSEGLLRSLLILIGMLVLVIGSIHCQGWKLTKTLGGIMFVFYVGFLLQAIIFELPFDICV